MFGWLKRSRAATAPAKPRKKRLPERKLAPVEDIVEQGLLVSDVSVRMTVKNAIIMNALGHKADYDETQIEQMVRQSLLELAEERESDAKHIAAVRGEVRIAGLSSWNDTNYTSGDSRTLKHRQAVYERVAEVLRERADDEQYLAELAEKARASAWGEIGDSLKEKASHPYYSGGASDEYKRVRDERIQLLIQRDLTELMAQHAADQGGFGKRRKFGTRKASGDEQSPS